MTTPSHLLRVYNSMNSSRKTRVLKIVEEPRTDQGAEQIERESLVHAPALAPPIG